MGMKDFEERSDHSKFALLIRRRSSALPLLRLRKNFGRKDFPPFRRNLLSLLPFASCFDTVQENFREIIPLLSIVQLLASKCFHNPVRA